MCHNRELLVPGGTPPPNPGPTLLRTNAKTVMDYAVTSPHLFSSFIILDFMDESEHAPLSLSLNILHTLPLTNSISITPLPLSKPSPLPLPSNVDLALINLLRHTQKSASRPLLVHKCSPDYARMRELRRRSICLRNDARPAGAWFNHTRSENCKILNTFTSLSRQKKRNDSEDFASKRLALNSKSAFWNQIKRAIGKKPMIAISADLLEVHFRSLYALQTPVSLTLTS